MALKLYPKTPQKTSERPPWAPNTPWQGPPPGQMATAFKEAFCPLPDQPIPLSAFTTPGALIANFLADPQPITLARVARLLQRLFGRPPDQAEVDDFLDMLQGLMTEGDPMTTNAPLTLDDVEAALASLREQYWVENLLADNYNIVNLNFDDLARDLLARLHGILAMKVNEEDERVQ